MNNKKAKKLRQILSPENPISKRAYRRAKKIYNRLSEVGKRDFLDGLQALVND